MKIKKSNISSAFIFMILIISTQVSSDQKEIKPFKKGSFKQIQLAHTVRPYIITFWSETCAYCMKELSFLGKLLPKYPNVDIVSVTTDPFLDKETITQILSAKKLLKSDKWVFADNYAERLYFDVDKKWRGELPFTLFFDRSKKMIKHLGTINEKELVEWLTEQNKAQ
jgi:thiol-disulfide isomerase/thioredoxin